MSDNAWKVVPARIGFGPQQAELADRIARNTATDGVHPTAIPGLSLVRAGAPTPLKPVLCPPSLSVAVQGRLRLRLLDAPQACDPQHLLVVPMALALGAQAVEASPAHPLLCVRIELDPLVVEDLLEQLGPSLPPPAPMPGLLVQARTSGPLLDAVLRLVRLLDTPAEAAVLAPLALREIHYRLLAGEAGPRLRGLCAADAPARRIGRATELLRARIAGPLRVGEIANAAGLGRSALHQRFKAATGLSPLQFHKRLRLDEARRLMLVERLDAAAAGRSVGYASPSQFSRDYRRLFGAPPRREVAALRRSRG